MMTGPERARHDARLNRQELIDAKLTRRDLARMGLLTTAGLLIPKGGLSARAVDSADQVLGTTASPPTRPFHEEFRRLDVPEPCSENKMCDNFDQTVPVLPQKTSNWAKGEGRTRVVEHQRYDEFHLTSTAYYDIWEREGEQSFHQDLPKQKVWGFADKLPDGTIREAKFPGPAFHGRYGAPVCWRMHNDLPLDHVGFGMPETSTHLHNGHTASESDGNPLDYFSPGKWYDQHYPNILAGHDDYPPDPVTGLRGDCRETMSTMWYHDHRFDFTAQNTYKGLEGMYLLFGPHDSGNENDSNQYAFRLPSGDFDVPMLFADKVFDPTTGEMVFDMFNFDGILGDKFTVNGRIQPHMKVHPRKYRFRCLNGGPSRFYQFFLTEVNNTNKVVRFKQISNDGNLLPAPVEVSSITLSVAERMDIIVDFSTFAGKSFYLENRMPQIDGRGPKGKTLAAGQGNLVMRFDVCLEAVADPSQVPAKFFDLPPVNLSEVKQTRTFNFDRQKGAWTVNGHHFDPERIDAKPRRGTSEIWVIRNSSGGWEHPIHMHFEEVQILSRNGKTPPTIERARKDTIRLGRNEEVRLHMRFRDWTGVYPMHCHNTIHEDHAMMMLWEVRD